MSVPYSRLGRAATLPVWRNILTFWFNSNNNPQHRSSQTLAVWPSARQVSTLWRQQGLRADLEQTRPLKIDDKEIIDQEIKKICFSKLLPSDKLGCKLDGLCFHPTQVLADRILCGVSQLWSQWSHRWYRRLPRTLSRLVSRHILRRPAAHNYFYQSKNQKDLRWKNYNVVVVNESISNDLL